MVRVAAGQGGTDDTIHKLLFPETQRTGGISLCGCHHVLPGSPLGCFDSGTGVTGASSYSHVALPWAVWQHLSCCASLLGHTCVWVCPCWLLAQALCWPWQTLSPPEP